MLGNKSFRQKKFAQKMYDIKNSPKNIYSKNFLHSKKFSFISKKISRKKSDNRWCYIIKIFSMTTV